MHESPWSLVLVSDAEVLGLGQAGLGLGHEVLGLGLGLGHEVLGLGLGLGHWVLDYNTDVVCSKLEKTGPTHLPYFKFALNTD